MPNNKLLDTRNLEFHIYRKLIEEHTAEVIFNDLRVYIKRLRRNKKHQYPFVASFPNEIATPEKEFQQKICQHVLSVYSKQFGAIGRSTKGQKKLSISGVNIHVMFLHPESEVHANQAPVPSVVFNFYSMWEKPVVRQHTPIAKRRKKIPRTSR